MEKLEAPKRILAPDWITESEGKGIHDASPEIVAWVKEQTEEADGSLKKSGVEIVNVDRGSAAYIAGIQKGEILTAIDGKSIDFSEFLQGRCFTAPIHVATIQDIHGTKRTATMHPTFHAKEHKWLIGVHMQKPTMLKMFQEHPEDIMRKAFAWDTPEGERISGYIEASPVVGGG